MTRIQPSVRVAGGRAASTQVRPSICYTSLKGDMRVPNRPPPPSHQLTLKQRPSKTKARIDDDNPISVSGELK
jgi:hypothetical protein